MMFFRVVEKKMNPKTKPIKSAITKNRTIVPVIELFFSCDP